MTDTSVQPIWAIMPVLRGPEVTEAALADLFGQSVPTKVLIVNQGVDDDFRRRLERLAEQYDDQLFVWHHVPPLLSLSATWNLGLRFVWATGGEVALVVNNDVRLHPRTIETLAKVQQCLEAYFVSAVGVRKEQFDPTAEIDLAPNPYGEPEKLDRGGPDFSCFLLSRTGHEAYPFDENFMPAFCEDLDTHRRYLLGGDGARIFSVNLPYFHVGSQTLKSMDPAARRRLEQQIDTGSRAYYRQKWGGDGVNAERYTIPFEAASDQDGVTTPELFESVRQQWREERYARQEP